MPPEAAGPRSRLPWVRFDSEVLEDLATRFVAVERGRTVLVGIDGRGGSGKSTLARELEALLADVTVVEFDDFYRVLYERRLRAAQGDDEVGGDFDWRRVRDQVLQPLADDEVARYRRYDWDRDELAEWHVISPGGIVILEGNYSTRRELRAYYNVTIWVDTPHDVRLRRGVERDGEDARARWLDEWIPKEDRYVAAHQPANQVDIIISGTGSTD
jgi:uridine kinase